MDERGVSLYRPDFAAKRLSLETTGSRRRLRGSASIAKSSLYIS